MEVSASNSWNQFELSENEDETLGNSFFTVGLFKVSNNEKVRLFCSLFQFDMKAFPFVLEHQQPSCHSMLAKQQDPRRS